MNYIKKSILRYFMIHYYNHIFLCLSNETWSPTHFFKGEQKYDTLWWDKTYEINQPRSFHEMSWFSYIKFVGRRAVSVFDFWENLSTSSRWMISMISIYYVEDSPPPFFQPRNVWSFILTSLWVVDIWVTLGKTCANMEEWCMNKCFSVDRFSNPPNHQCRSQPRRINLSLAFTQVCCPIG